MTTKEAMRRTLDEIRDRSAYALAQDVDCACPDALDSPGARLLAGTRDAFLEEVERIGADLHPGYDLMDLISNVTDGMPSDYTHSLWSEFVDLGGYSEDVSEYASDLSDMTETARIALHVILRRMCDSLACEIKDALTDDDMDDDMDDDDVDDDMDGE